jgi:hypothetical protein
MKRQHTPGPWNVSERGSIEFEDGFVGEAYEYDPKNDDELPMMANARLMAAAPEMLRLIQRLTSPYMAEPQYRMDAFIDANEIVKQITQGDEID